MVCLAVDTSNVCHPSGARGFCSISAVMYDGHLFYDRLRRTRRALVAHSILYIRPLAFVPPREQQGGGYMV